MYIHTVFVNKFKTTIFRCTYIYIYSCVKHVPKPSKWHTSYVFHVDHPMASTRWKDMSKVQGLEGVAPSYRRSQNV